MEISIFYASSLIISAGSNISSSSWAISSGSTSISKKYFPSVIIEWLSWCHCTSDEIKYFRSTNWSSAFEDQGDFSSGKSQLFWIWRPWYPHKHSHPRKVGQEYQWLSTGSLPEQHLCGKVQKLQGGLESHQDVGQKQRHLLTNIWLLRRSSHFNHAG